FLGVGGLVVISKDRLAASWLCVAKDALGREAEDHGVSSELVAIVELHALAEFQLNGLVVDAGPFGGKAWDRSLIAHPVAEDEAFPQVGIEDALADIGLFVPDVERVVVGDLLDGDGNRRAAALAEGDAW